MIHRHGPSTRTDPLPTSVKPMLAMPGDLPADDEHWAFEIKWDGVRTILFVEGGRVRAQSRNDLDVTAAFPELADVGKFLGMTTCVLDGEVVALGEDGRPSFSRLQHRMHVANQREARRRAAADPVSFVAFDLLYIDGHLLTRRQPTTSGGRGSSRCTSRGETFTTTESFRDVSGRDILDAATANGLEGVVAKRRDSPYRPGRRSPDWVKVKSFRTQEVVIGGWTEGRGERDGGLGALLLGSPRARRAALRREGGHRVQRAGPPGSPGRTSPARRRRRAPSTPPSPRGRRPTRTSCGRPWSGRWRTASGRRPAGCATRRGGACGPTNEDADEVVGGMSRRPSTSTQRRTIGGRELSVSNLDKEFFPQSGFTKGQLIDYYVRIAEAMLPHVTRTAADDAALSQRRRRKVLLREAHPVPRPEVGAVGDRAVDGRTRGRSPTPWRTTSRHWPGRPIWATSSSTCRLWHVGRRRKLPANPDHMVFDLDPGEGTSIVECCVVAGYIIEELEKDGTSSRSPRRAAPKGLQLYAPAGPKSTWDGVRRPRPRHRPQAGVRPSRPRRLEHAQVPAARTGPDRLEPEPPGEDHRRGVLGARHATRPTVSTPVTAEEVQPLCQAEEASTPRLRDGGRAAQGRKATATSSPRSGRRSAANSRRGQQARCSVPSACSGYARHGRTHAYQRRITMPQQTVEPQTRTPVRAHQGGPAGPRRLRI